MKISKTKIAFLFPILLMFSFVFVVHADTSTSTDLGTATTTDIGTATTTDTGTSTTTDLGTSTTTTTTIPPINIHLKILSDTQTLYDNEESVSSCESNPGSGVQVISGYCAIIQSGVTSDWSWYGTDGFLNSINGTVNDFSNTYTSWSWFNDLNYGSTSLSTHLLTSGESLLVNYNINPLKISVSNLNPAQNDIVTITLSQFSLDSNYNPVWNVATSGSIIVNGISNPVLSDGTFLLTLDSTNQYKISGSESGFVDSNTIILNPTAVATTNDFGGSSGGGNSGGNILPTNFDVSKALSYLYGVQGSDGSFSGSGLYTDWTAVALGSTNSSDSARSNIISYMKLHNTVSSYLTENERHCIALLSLGQNPYSFNGSDFITPIIKSFDGAQFGDSSIDNDDIFALIPLSSSGYTSSDEIISKDISFILGKQQSNGSWDGSTDMTAAAIMALKPFEDVSGVSVALLKAGAYLENSQNNDGGWGNISSSAWAVQAMNALGLNWVKNGKTTSDYFALQQVVDGAVLPQTEAVQNRIWTISYVIPAFLGKTWSQIMQPVSKPEIVGSNSIDSDNNIIIQTSTSTNLTATTTIEVPNISTSTATSTIELIVTADKISTSTATSTIKNFDSKPKIKKIAQKLNENNLGANVLDSGLTEQLPQNPAPRPRFSFWHYLWNIFFGK